jgi:histidyl-tRNA synthetase
MISIPKGTKDILPQDSGKWQYIENIAREITAAFGFKEIRTPAFEHTELFLRGVGETTDIVNKEMYTFNDKGGRSITLKPEGTAGVARSFIENNLGEILKPQKLYYLNCPVFRYERPQAGRLREHHQFGVELYGSYSPFADAEVITLANTFLTRVGVTEIELNINNIGCKTCRKNYNEALKSYVLSRLNDMCAQCNQRAEKNPLRILDCKEDACKKINQAAPKTLQHLCESCQNHHKTLKTVLTSCGINFKENPLIVRGLDYYTGTVFEFISKSIGAQGTVVGGGRYNNMIEELGGKETPAVGFGIGIERLILVLESLNCAFAGGKTPLIFIAPLGEKQYITASVTTLNLRQKGIAAETDIAERGLKAQMKHANKIGAKYVLVLGETEVATGKAKLKDMLSGNEEEIELENLYERISK